MSYILIFLVINILENFVKTESFYFLSEVFKSQVSLNNSCHTPLFVTRNLFTIVDYTQGPISRTSKLVKFRGYMAFVHFFSA